MDLSALLRDKIREIPDFPMPGVLFKDITPVFHYPGLCRNITLHIAEQFPQVDAIAGIESRGFFWGMSVAQHLQVPFIPIRKKGKLPYRTLSQSYDLEYGSATLQMHEDAIEQGWSVLIHDDLLATGGTAAAAAHLIRQRGDIAGFSFLIELQSLNGREKLLPFGKKMDTLIIYK